MSTAEEATVNPDGSTTFDDAGANYTNNTTDSGIPNMDEEAAEEVIKGTDPALYLAIAVVCFAVIFIFIQLRKKRKSDEIDSFFSNLDGDKFNLQLPPSVDDYYEVKAKCEKAGWEPGQSTGAQPSPHHRALAQALMKRCIDDIPIVTHIQRESPGMNKLYSQSMCSVKQWKSYQAAEAMVSAEVEEVRAEADEIEPGWSQVSITYYPESTLPSCVSTICTNSNLTSHYFFISHLLLSGHLETSHAIQPNAQTKGRASQKSPGRATACYRGAESSTKRKGRRRKCKAGCHHG